MKFKQIMSHMLPPIGNQGPIIGLFALGEDGNVYQYQRSSPSAQYWEKLTDRVIDDVSNMKKDRAKQLNRDPEAGDPKED